MKELNEFCIAAIQQRFGDLGAAIATALTRRNGQNIPSLAKSTGLDIELVARGITSLVQHDIIRIAAPKTYIKPSLNALAAKKRSASRGTKRISSSSSASFDSDLDMSDDDDDEDETSTLSGNSSAARSFTHPSALFGDPSGGMPPAHVVSKLRRSIIHHPIHTRRGFGSHDSYYGGSRETVKKFNYFIDIDMVLGLSRLPDYLTLTRKLYGAEAHALLEEFGVRGKLTLSQALSTAYFRMERQLEDIEKSKADGTYVEPHRLTEGILIKNAAQVQYMTKEIVEKIPFMSLTELANLPEEILHLYKQNTTITQEIIDHINQNLAKNEQTGTLPERLRVSFERLLNSGFLIPSTNYYCKDDIKIKRKRDDDDEDGGIDGGVDSHKKLRTNTNDSNDPLSNLSNALSATTSSSSSTSSYNSNNSTTNTPYIINHDRFTILIRNELILDYTRRRLVDKKNAEVGTVVKDTKPVFIMQVLLYALDSSAQSQNKSYFTIHEISSLLHQYLGSEIAIDISMDDIKYWMDEMISENTVMATGRTNDMGVFEYSLIIEGILQAIRLEHAQCLVVERCGKNAGRLFRLFSEKSRLEEKQISDFTLIPRKDCKEVLYSMLKSQFVELQEIPRTSDRQPSKAFFTWSIPHLQLPMTFLSLLLRSWTNLRTRLTYETMLIQDILDKGFTMIDYEDDEREKVDKWAKMFAKSETSLRGVSRLIMLFRDLTP